MRIETILYRAEAKATGGRDGRAVSSDGVLDVKLTVPKALGGDGKEGTNPEQLFAAGYAACFLGAMKFVAGRDKLPIAKDVSVTGRVGIGQIPTGFGIEVELVISLPGIDPVVAGELIERANVVCPYSNATHGNIHVELTLAS